MTDKYSGHLLLMVSLYSILFNDDRYDKEDSLVFDWNPIFWGMGPERFCYDRKSLQKAILSEMELEGWLGVCCEPNSIFLVCNQFPVGLMVFLPEQVSSLIQDILSHFDTMMCEMALTW